MLKRGEGLSIYTVTTERAISVASIMTILTTLGAMNSGHFILVIEFVGFVIHGVSEE